MHLDALYRDWRRQITYIGLKKQYNQIEWKSRLQLFILQITQLPHKSIVLWRLQR